MAYRFSACIAVLACIHLGAAAQEDVIRKNLTERVPQLQIDEVNKSAMTGLFEVRANGTDIYYTDAQANYFIQGSLVDLKSKRNLTDERVTKLTAIAFKALPLNDAFTIVRGNGERKLAMFEDPNCGYCKRLERDLLKVDNVTVHLFLLPILGADSVEKSKAIWCAKDRGQAWLDWMVRDKALPAAGTCDIAALTRNVELARKHHITATPTLVFADSTRVPGAIGAAQIEQQLTASVGKE